MLTSLVDLLLLLSSNNISNVCKQMRRIVTEIFLSQMDINEKLLQAELHQLSIFANMQSQQQRLAELAGAAIQQEEQLI